MTVTYLEYVHTASWKSFFRLLGIWRGSIWKGTCRKLGVFCLLYTLISLGYRFVLIRDEETKKMFEILCNFMNKYEHFLPLNFILGFYVTQVRSGYKQTKPNLSLPGDQPVLAAVQRCGLARQLGHGPGGLLTGQWQAQTGEAPWQTI